MLLRVIGGITMLLSALAFVVTFAAEAERYDGDFGALLPILGLFVSGAALSGLGTIQEDVRALRQQGAAEGAEKAASEVEKLEGLWKRGAISHTEFEREKNRLLNH